MGITRLLESDVNLIARLLEDPDEWGDDPRKFSRKILRALYDNDSVAALNATRGIIVVQGAPGIAWGIGPYPTVDAARTAASLPTFTGFSGKEKLSALLLRHPDRYYEERKKDGSVARVSSAAQPKAA